MGGPPQGRPVVVEIPSGIHLMLSEQTATSSELSASSFHPSQTSQPLNCCIMFTSRIKNFAVLALLQVFFSRDTGLMFIPAVGEKALLIPGHARLYL